MNTFIYILIFIIGTLFGSFFSLAVYRIPIKESIMHGRSYCPKCNHSLEFLDLIPILSYLFLGGKCRYCKEKIRIRYICLEILSGLVFLLFAISLNINIYNIQVEKIVYLILGILFISSLFIIGGIEKEKHYISNSVLLFGLVIEIIYIIYLYVLKVSIYKYAIYLFIILILKIINILLLKKKKNIYAIDILMLYIYIGIFVREEFLIFSAIFTFILTLINRIYTNVNNKTQKNTDRKIPIGFYLCATNVSMIILQNYI